MRTEITRRVPGTSSAGRLRRVPCFCHVVHFAMAAGGQPVEQMGFGLAQFGVGDADLLEAKRVPPGLDVAGQGGVVDRNGLSGAHLPL